MSTVEVVERNAQACWDWKAASSVATSAWLARASSTLSGRCFARLCAGRRPMILRFPSCSARRPGVLQVIDEGSQFRHHLMAAGIVEKHTRRGWRERLQDVYEFSRLRRSSSDRCRELRKTPGFDGRAKHGGEATWDRRYPGAGRGCP